MIIQEYLKQAKHVLSVVTDAPQLEAECLLARVLNKSRSYLYAKPEEIVSVTAANHFSNLLNRRCQGEPLAYIVGKKEFWSLDFSVTPATLIPRPETELLIEILLEKFPDVHSKMKVADLGTGSGIIALTLKHERPQWEVVGVDVNRNALAVAKANANDLGISPVSFIESDWCTNLPDTDFDVIISNPPYIAENEWEAYAGGLAFEPKQALISGKDGLDAIRNICKTARNYLKLDGILLLEHGFLQGSAVRELLLQEGYMSVSSFLDLSGHERATLGRCFFLA